MKILAVDDDPFIIELLPMIAAKAGFTDVTTASSGALALQAMATSADAFECLLLDISMPDMDGMELCVRARLIPAYRRTPIIMLTAMVEKEYLDAAFKAGATDYATKPFDIMELGARLRVAQELVIARRDAVGGDMNGTARHEATTDAIQIKAGTELIEYVALRNYLAQKSRAGLAASQVIAVRIDQVDVIHARATAAEFNYALAEVADAVADTLLTSGYLMAYAGRGTFIIVSNAATVVPGIDIESEIQSLLDSKNAEYDSGDPLDIDVSVGNPIHPNVGHLSDVNLTFERAIARADHRAIAKQTEARPMNIHVL